MNTVIEIFKSFEKSFREQISCEQEAIVAFRVFLCMQSIGQSKSMQKKIQVFSFNLITEGFRFQRETRYKNKLFYSQLA